MAAIPIIYGESSWLRTVITTLGCTPVETLITAIGTKYDFTMAVKATPTFAAAAAASTTDKWHTTDGSNGNQYSVPDNSKNYNIIDGEEISEDTNAATTDKMDCSVFLTPAQRSAFITAYQDGVPVIVSREIGKDGNTGVAAGYEYLLGIISDLKDNPQKGPGTMDFTITGKVVGTGGSFTIAADVDEVDYNAIATGSGNTITPHNDGTARTITALTSGDWDDTILAGKIVIKLVT